MSTFFARTVLLLTIIANGTSFLYSQTDSVSITGSPQIGHPNNLLLERLQYKDGLLFRNDFIRDYSPFDKKDIGLASQESFADELMLRQSAPRKEITWTLSDQANSITFIPLLGATFYGANGYSPYWKRSNGLSISGFVGDNFVFYAKAIDNVIRGASPDMNGILTSQPGYERSIAYSKNGYDYDDTEVQLGFRFGVTQLFVEKIRNTWGYGRGGSLVLSQRAPSYPQIRFSVQFLPNLKFTMLVASLYSGLIDSARSYTDYTDGTFQTYRVVNREKYLFAHSLEYSPIQQLNLTLGEEVVVSDKFDPGYLLPVAFYHNLEIQSGGLDNINIWGGARYTFRGKGSLYTTLYLDNFDVNESFYIFAGTVGGTLVDVASSNIDVTLEYTALKPFVYSNDITACNRTSNGYVLGYWLGEDGDALQGWVDCRPSPTFWLTASYAKIRKGPVGTTAQHYAGGTAHFANLGFLDGPLYSRNEFNLRCKWELWSGLFADLSYRLITQSDAVPNRYPDYSHRSFVSLALQLNIFEHNDEY